ncbi:MAG: hypothetical protein MO852_09220 [Candidatus Devosia euplotis]|nr:hypothetical protein [Candidatus Devosia euplotis]
MARWRAQLTPMEAMARRGWARLAAGVDGAENWGNLGDSFRIGRMLASGDLRLVVLYLIKAIEYKSGGGGDSFPPVPAGSIPR